jgi:pyruvate kinase
MALYWGVKPCAFDSAENHSDEIERALRVVQNREQLTNGARVVVTGGRLTKTPGSTSVLEVRELNYK